MIESYKYNIEFVASSDVYEKIRDLIKEIAPDSYYKIKVTKELNDVTFKCFGGNYE